MIYITSDLHIGHDRDFIVQDRGFQTITDHDNTIVERWNKTVSKEDEVYLLGDVMMKDTDYGMKILESLNGHIHIIRGNHDTDEKIKAYLESDNVIEAVAATYYRMGKITFYMSHYPTLVSHSKLKKMNHALINLYGHTHQKTNFYDDGIHGPHPYMYHVGVDSHNLTPILLEDIVEEIRQQKVIYDNMHPELKDDGV